MNPALLADLIVVVHFLFILGVIVPVPLILIGGVRKWRWVRDWRVRIAHLLMIVFVAGESIFKVRCPLTVWENKLRAQAGQVGNGDSFVAYWMHQLIFYSLPAWGFMCLYIGFGLLVALLFVVYPPQRKPA